MLVGEYLKNIGNVSTSNWVDATDKYMQVYQLLKDGRYNEAKYVLEGYLIKKAKDGEGMKELLRNDTQVPIATTEKLGRTIDDQVKNIVDCLRTLSFTSGFLGCQKSSTLKS
jgi:hypothetical protein